ncbi:MAG TPA: adenylate kinase, partial [Dehalococcoidia bacterium]|nr:adenylate kinase [Dehalococcoidia bacterium]
MRRIAIFGPSGSGKSTVARDLGRMLDLPVVELDALFHRPNWEPTPADEFRAIVARTLASHTDGWVCDGNYGVVRPLVLAQADTVVWLRLPFPLVYFRL